MLSQSRCRRQPAATPDLRVLEQLLEPALAGRLRTYAIVTAEDWFRLGRRKHQLFGVTKKMVLTVGAALTGTVRPRVSPPS